ncbi:hypothetical protein [Tropicimonas sediminicola]|uniref:DUF4386 domain-containing protein n=1 Tax=Tropicimonas sediminicola TaxID=1031541 RepID=A0A239KPZ2_9RHOB|nr:hypothetical protein [Tropicimonas sediminicola]SNT20090.1 hypothetical protein SAMN05421757_107271 [Tropicimonas sediminicola]
MTLQHSGGIAALLCGATYVAGFALLVTLLAPLGYGTEEIDTHAVAALAAAHPGLLIAWNSTIYIINGLALAVLTVALAERFLPRAPGWSGVSRALGLIWATLVLGAGMVANVAVERTSALHATDPQGAADLWGTLHAIELGLGGGNEIVGGAWILSISIAGLAFRRLPRGVALMGLLTGLAGLATLVPALGTAAGAGFGLGGIAWFLAVGVALVRDPGPPASHQPK